MEPWLEALIARGRITGVLTFDEVNAAAPRMMEPEQLDAVVERFEREGITLIDGEEPDAPSPEPPAPEPHSDTDILGGHYHRNAEFDKLLRDHGIPFSDAACSFESDTRVFDAELIVPGERALAAWLELRNLVTVTRLWPVIHEQTPGPTFIREPRFLDPGRRRPEWDSRPYDQPPPPELTPVIVRADAAANIAEAEKVPPTPWTFRKRSGTFPEPTGPDTALEPSELNFAELFSNAGPFHCHRQAAGGSAWPSYPFVRLRLYPTAVPWEVFAYSPFGGWNDVPGPEEQLAMLRHWHELYGAEIVSGPGDWYELFVPRPPRTRHQALRLLAEMRWFGEETIFGYASVTDDAAAERVRTSHYWYFWWD